MNLTNDNKDSDWRFNQSGKTRHVMRRRVLRRLIVFLRVRCSILILLIKLFVVAFIRFSIVHCNIPHFSKSLCCQIFCLKFTVLRLTLYSSVGHSCDFENVHRSAIFSLWFINLNTLYTQFFIHLCKNVTFCPLALHFYMVAQYY
jgi:hypothetical protein